jgi:hypothetical protein
MSTYIITVAGTYISPFSDSDTYNVLHGGYLNDPMASPLSFFYASTANGGLIPTTYDSYLSGGIFEIAYADLPENVITLSGHYIFCNTEVIFDFKNFDQSVSKIIKLVFDAGNGENLQTYNSYVSNNEFFYPTLSSIKSTYYPSETYYTKFYPNFKIYYLDGNIVNLTIPLTSVQCGIYESYKDKTIVDVIPLYKNTGDVVAFINDTSDDNIIAANISTYNTFEPNFETTQIALSSLYKLSPIALAFLQLPPPPFQENPVIPIIPTTGNGIITFVTKMQMTRFGSGIEIYPFSNSTVTFVTIIDNIPIIEIGGIGEIYPIP